MGVVEMKKEDLKIGYLVEYRNGYKRIVMPYGLVNENGDTRNYFSNYDDELISFGFNRYDIIKVYDIYEYDFDWKCNHRKLLWQRKEITLTPAEIQLLELLHCQYKYITRDTDSSLTVHQDKPYRQYIAMDNRFWISAKEAHSIEAFDGLFKFITIDHEKPYDIGELLKCGS